MSDDPHANDFTRTGTPAPEPVELPVNLPVPEQESSANPVLGGILSFLGLILLSFILRLAVPQEDNAVELGLLLIAVGFAQVWLIFYLLKTFRR
jgi:hypothetical protein